MYAALYAGAKHTVVKPGDKIPFAGVDVTVVTAAGQAIKTPLPGGGKPNPACADFKPRDETHIDPRESAIRRGGLHLGKVPHHQLGRLHLERRGEADVPE
jgi:hypothetical protein